MQEHEKCLRVLQDWYDALPCFADKLPSKGSVAAALHVLDRLSAEFSLDIDDHIAGGKAQIAGLSGETVKRLLGRFGEHRRLSSEAGRSNRGARRDIETLLASLQQLDLDQLPPQERSEALAAMQRYIVDVFVAKYFAVKRVKAAFDPNGPTRLCIESILKNAKEAKKAGPVAEHLVGAKLALRFPDVPIRNKPFSEADEQRGFVSDFEVGNTAFHVTMAPMPHLFEKCKANLQDGMRVYVLVPDVHLSGARDHSGLLAEGRIAVESVESFVSTNVDELAGFDGSQLKTGMRRLLEKYNERVAAVEIDQSLLIEIPPNLL